MHWLAYACWPVAMAHGLGIGTDRSATWVIATDDRLHGLRRGLSRPPGESSLSMGSTMNTLSDSHRARPTGSRGCSRGCRTIGRAPNLAGPRADLRPAARRGSRRFIDVVDASGLTGRGGVGFPTGRKMRGVAAGRGAGWWWPTVGRRAGLEQGPAAADQAAAPGSRWFGWPPGRRCRPGPPVRAPARDPPPRDLEDAVAERVDRCRVT